MSIPTNDPIAAALGTGDPVLAERLCRQRLELAPADAQDVQVLLATSLWHQGRHDEAIEIHERLTREHPDSPLHWGNYATSLQLRGDLVAAERAAMMAARLAPDDPMRLDRLGLLQLQRGLVREAFQTLLRGLDRSPDSPVLRIHAARACAAWHDYRVAQLIEPWRQWLPLPDGLQYELADLLIASGAVDDARGLLMNLVQRAPSHWPAQLLLAWSCERLGRLEEAETVLQRVIEARPAVDDAGLLRDLALQRARLALRKGEPALARTILDEVRAGKPGDALSGFLLAKACDALGDADAAMLALGDAHARQVADLRGAVPDLLRPDAVLLPGATDRVSAADFRGWPGLEAPDAMHSPVFVVGFPRSGTTLLEQMLDAHPSLQSMDERPFFQILADRLQSTAGSRVPGDLGRLDQRRCDELRQTYLAMADATVSRRPGTRLVDKNPLNMLWLPMIYRLFPHAKFILAIRHPCDVVMSCYQQNFFAPALAAASRSIESLARNYVAAMESWLHHSRVMQPDVLVSRYEDLVIDPEGQLQRIAAFLEVREAKAMLAFDARARARRFIATASYAQVIEPLTASRVGRWQRYRKYLEPSLPILRPMLEHWQYPVEPDEQANWR